MGNYIDPQGIQSLRSDASFNTLVKYGEAVKSGKSNGLGIGFIKKGDETSLKITGKWESFKAAVAGALGLNQEKIKFRNDLAATVVQQNIEKYGNELDKFNKIKPLDPKFYDVDTLKRGKQQLISAKYALEHLTKTKDLTQLEELGGLILKYDEEINKREKYMEDLSKPIPAPTPLTSRRPPMKRQLGVAPRSPLTSEYDA